MKWKDITKLSLIIPVKKSYTKTLRIETKGDINKDTSQVVKTNYKTSKNLVAAAPYDSLKRNWKRPTYINRRFTVHL